MDVFNKIIKKVIGGLFNKIDLGPANGSWPDILRSLGPANGSWPDIVVN